MSMSVPSDRSGAEKKLQAPASHCRHGELCAAVTSEGHSQACISLFRERAGDSILGLKIAPVGPIA
jgi:hypothetical protein